MREVARRSFDSMKIPGSVLPLMERMTFDGNLAKLAPETLDGETFMKLFNTMRALGARMRSGAFNFPEGVDARAAVRDAIALREIPETKDAAVRAKPYPGA